jgi:diadenosine tetraphosphatase ApaH/serine/threonine PP2A family protein phosphatase
VRHLFVHAAPSDPLYRYLGPDAGEWLSEVAGLEADVVVAGHTHLQFDLRAGSLRIVNPGSVGQPKDGDPRAAYAILQDGEVVLERVAYHVEDTIGALREVGIRNEVVDVLGELLQTGNIPP